MNTPIQRLHLNNTILDTPENRYCEIYKITNNVNNKIYIGQAVSHILNHKKYRPYGSIGRFKCHISEAHSTKKCQSFYLNNAILKYGETNFTVEILEYCELNDADKKETEQIIAHNSLYPNGYNLKLGGFQFTHSDESKQRLSRGVYNYYKNKKFDRFKNVKYIDIQNIEQYIKPLRRDNNQYGWYVYIDKCKTDFGGVHIPLDVSKQNAIDFIYHIAKYLDAGNPLEPLLPPVV